jgi:rod shape-determining protein MreC
MRSLYKLLIGFILSVGLLLFLVDRIFFFKPSILERTAAKLLYPIYVCTGAISSQLADWKSSYESYATLRQRFDRQSKDYYEVLDELVMTRAAAEVYKNVKEIVEFKERYAVQALTSKILFRTLSDREHSFIVNRGLRDGVKKDMIAFYQRHIVGRVSEVFDFYSKITLITDQHCKIAAYSNKSRASGIVQGYNVINRCNFTYVSHLYTLNDNDLVISSGQGLVFPEGFCLGRIVVHSLQPKALYHHVEVEQLINFKAIKYCLLADNSTIKPF